MITAKTLLAALAPLKNDPFVQIGGAGDFMTALDQLKGSPSLFVLPSAKLPGANTAGTSLVVQRVTGKFSLVIGMNKIGQLGAAAFDRLEEYDARLIDALVGTQPEGALTPIVYAGGRMVAIDVDKGIMFWGSDFAADYWLRK